MFIQQKFGLGFAKNSLKYPVGQALFPENHEHAQNVKTQERFVVNFANTESFKRSAVPYCQNLMNADLKTREANVRAKEEARAWRREGG